MKQNFHVKKNKKSDSLNVVCQWLPKKARKEKSLFMSYSKREERVAKIYASLAFEIQIFYAGKQQDCVCQQSHAKLSCWAPEINKDRLCQQSWAQPFLHKLKAMQLLRAAHLPPIPSFLVPRV